MTKYINAAEAAEKVAAAYKIPTGDLVDVFASISAADVTPVIHGSWIEKPFLMGTSRFCSKCGDNFGMPHGVYRYCPTCGARMDGEN